MKNFIVLFCLCLAIAACQTSNKETVESPVPTLTMKWETDTVLTTCESVLYDPTNDVLYVANIAGNPEGKDGNGFISKVGLDGKVTNASWVKGLDAPKGMSLWDGKLYVADIDRIHVIDIAAGTIANSYQVDSAKFLNDVTVDSKGRVFVSDSQAGNVYLLEDGKVSKYLTGQDGPNGLFAEGDNMLMALWNPKTLNLVDASGQITMKTDSIDNPDGIEAVGNGGYLVSSWNGMVHYVDPNWKKTLILDMRSDSVSAADIEYIPEKNLLLVPTFFKNTVRAYDLAK